MKEKKFQLSTFVGKRKNLGATLQRKSTIINNGNLVPVREELSQLDNLFKIIEDTRKEMINLDKAIYSDDQWFEKFDEKTFAIKHTACSWLKEAERKVDDPESRRASSKKK